MAAKPKPRGIKIDKGCNSTKLPLNSISVIERPEEGHEHEVVFFNPRDPANFTIASMEELRYSIRTDDLLENLVVRADCKNDTLTNVQLLAGERRFRTLLGIVKDNVACYSPDAVRPAKWRAKSVVIHLGQFAQIVKQSGNEVEIEIWDANDKPTGEKRTVQADDAELYPTLPASKVHKEVRCNIYRNCSDGRALRIAMTENEQHKKLTTAEEITVVERLIKNGQLTQEQMAYMLNHNTTWVCQTASFRHQLPQEAFDKLRDGDIKRNVAINLLRYHLKDRGELFRTTVLVEEQETSEAIRKHLIAMEAAMDEADMHEDDAVQAEAAGDKKTATNKRKKKTAAEKKADTAAKKKAKAEEDAGKIDEGHIQTAATLVDAVPRKPKMLPKSDVSTCFVKRVDELLEGDGIVIDPKCEKRVPVELLKVVKATASAILMGRRDPLDIIRGVRIELGSWADPDSDSDSSTVVIEDEDGEFDPDLYDGGDEIDPDLEEDFDVMDEIEDGVYSDDDPEEII